MGMTSNEGHSRREFMTTRWSVVLAARDSDTRQCAQALELLCQTYWFPLYAFVRRQGHSPDQAGDLTQGFFAQLLEKDWLAKITHQEGRFRNFLMVAMKHFISNERAKERAQKRGGGHRILRLDIENAETRYRIEPAAKTTPEQVFERQWALTLLDQVLMSLKAEYAKKGKDRVFDLLKHSLTGQRDQLDYGDLAEQLSATEGAVRVMVHRLKQRYRQLLREHIVHTVATPEEVDLEMQHLKQALARP
jgi:RNA polymerase sigma factor (sigma-70 family)